MNEKKTPAQDERNTKHQLNTNEKQRTPAQAWKKKQTPEQYERKQKYKYTNKKKTA